MKPHQIEASLYLIRRLLADHHPEFCLSKAENSSDHTNEPNGVIHTGAILGDEMGTGKVS
jgi:hypothetical protein